MMILAIGTDQLTQKENEEKDPCDEIAAKYPTIYNANPGDALSLNDAKQAGLISAGVAAYKDGRNHEFGGSIYRAYEYDLGSGYAGFDQSTRTQTGYSFTSPTKGFKGSWGFAWQSRNTWFKDNVAGYHNHNPGHFEALSGDDMDAADNWGGETLLLSPSYEMRSYTPDMGDPMNYGYSFGSPINGSPSPQETELIIKCKAAGE